MNQDSSKKRSKLVLPTPQITDNELEEVNCKFSCPLILTRIYAYQGVKNINFSENFAYVLNKWPLSSEVNYTVCYYEVLMKCYLVVLPPKRENSNKKKSKKKSFFFQKFVLIEIISICNMLCENVHETLLMDGNFANGEESYLIKDIYCKGNMI